MTAIKVLSIRQPWAELIMRGKKTIETRTIQRSYRGELYIHASKTIDKDAMKKLGFKDLPIGVIIGKVDFVDAKEYETESEFKKDKNKHYSNFDKIKYGWVFKNPQRIKPIPANGTLGIWNYEI